MSMPIPLIAPDTANDLLVDRFLWMETSNPAPDGTPPTLLVVMPTAWDNKYQLMLYSQAAAHRVVVAGLRQPETLAEVSWPGPVVLHCHWFAHVFEGVDTASQAKRRLAQLKDMLSSFRDRTGAKLLWTAHNVFPHGNRFPEMYLELRQWLFESFDAVHLLNADHLPILEQAFDRPAPAHFVAPHMSYRGMVPDFVTRTEARAYFGLPPEAFVFGYFGSLQAYKNPMALIDALARLKTLTDRPVRALIGGMPSDLDLVRHLQDRAQEDTDVQLIPKKVHESEIQYFHRASDVMVLPYTDALNSGVALMAASFGKPYLMPDSTTSRSLRGVGAMPYDPAAPDGLARAMLQAMETPQDNLFDTAAMAAIAPHHVSDLFFNGLAQVLGGADPVAPAAQGR